MDDAPVKTLHEWERKLKAKLRERGCPEEGVDRRAEELMAKILAAQKDIQARDQKVVRRLRAQGWPEDQIDQAVIELALRLCERFIRQQESKSRYLGTP
jgi:hypothetical protein